MTTTTTTTTIAESEQCLIGSILISPDILDEIERVVSPADFENLLLGSVLRVLLDLRDARTPLGDCIAIGRALHETRTQQGSSTLLSDIGGRQGLQDLFEFVSSPAFWQFHAQRIHDAATRRQLAVLARRLSADVLSGQKTVEDIIQGVDAALRQLEQRVGENDFSTLQEALGKAIDGMESAGNTPGDASVLTGLSAIDRKLGGLFRGDLSTLAARTSIGKSALGYQIAASAAEAGSSVVYFSFEMSDRDLANRHLGAELGVDLRSIRSGHVGHQTIQRAREFAETTGGQRFLFCYRPKINIRELAARCRMASARFGSLDLIVLDYLTYVSGSDQRAYRRDQISEIMKELKGLAGSLACPILLLSQLNRTGEGAPPTVDMLRESGSIEEDSDNVLLLHRPSRDSTEASLYIAKARNAPVCECTLEFDPKTLRFQDAL